MSRAKLSIRKLFEYTPIGGGYTGGPAVSGKTKTATLVKKIPNEFQSFSGDLDMVYRLDPPMEVQSNEATYVVIRTTPSKKDGEPVRGIRASNQDGTVDWKMKFFLGDTGDPEDDDADLLSNIGYVKK